MMDAMNRGDAQLLMSLGSGYDAQIIPDDGAIEPATPSNYAIHSSRIA